MYTESRNPGKFEGCASEWLGRILRDVAANDCCDDAIGSVNEMGWYGLVKGRRRAWIVQEDGFGFFYYTQYNDHEKAEREWSGLVDRYMAYYDGEIL